MKMTIDGIEIEAHQGESVLDATLNASIYIPHLCKHPDLEAVGGCRLCTVEVKGSDEVVPACKTSVYDGMNVSVHSPKAEKVRKMAMELILASHPADCTGCPKYGKCELQSMYQYMGVGPERWKKKSRVVPNDNSNPLIQHLFTRCVRCGRCIRACRELRGVGVLDYQYTKEGIRAGIDGGKSLKEAGCRFCGACIEVCPTGSIMDAVGLIRENTSYSDSVVPCRGACPAGVDIPRYVRHIKMRDFAGAAAVIRETVPIPGILGSICTHVCESKCKRGQLNESVSICRLKRSAAHYDDDTWKARRRKDQSTGKKVAVIGAGPAGLTAAYYLAEKGHKVKIFEANKKAGGQCRYGIPAYRMPDEVLDLEIGTLLEGGIALETGVRIASPVQLLEEGYDALLVAVGTHKGNVLPIEGNDLEDVLINTEFLKAAREGHPMPVGARVMVLGGGNVAYDCARTAVRLGAKEVHIACLESGEAMTASEDEVAEGAEEGIILHDGYSFLRIFGDTHAEGVELHKVKRFAFENGRAMVELEEGKKITVPVDTVIFAVGQKPDNTEEMGLHLIRGSYILTDENQQTNISGIFAAGDVVTGTRTVIEAVAAGRRSAQTIDRYLGGDGDITEHLVEDCKPNPYIGKMAHFSELERNCPTIVRPDVRRSCFDSVEEIFEEETAVQEAGRCLQCDLRLMLTQPKLWNDYQREGREQ